MACVRRIERKQEAKKLIGKRYARVAPEDQLYLCAKAFPCILTERTSSKSEFSFNERKKSLSLVRFILS